MSTAVITLRGELVGLGPIRKDLIPLYVKWWNDPEITMSLSGTVWPSTEKDQEEWYEKNASKGDGSTVNFLVYEVKTERPIGIVTLFSINYRNQSAWASSFIGERDCWGKGYATEARRLLLRFGFDSLGLHYVMVGIHADNVASLRVAEKIGYRVIGRQRQAVRKHDGYIDAILLDILREDLEEAWQ